jgi:tripartite-type tricarboxylate transporter receptor subunit TctC
LAPDIANATVEVIKTPDVQAKFRAASVDPIGNSPAEMAAFIKAEAQRWGDVIKKE